MAISPEEFNRLAHAVKLEVLDQLEAEKGIAFGKRKRRDVLKFGAAALTGGVLGTAGSAAGRVGAGGEVLDVATITSNTYRVAGNWYGGNEDAKAELVSELGSEDAGARYEADDTGVKFRWTGSAWTPLGYAGDRILDSSGRVLGELVEGEDAGAVLVDAIEDRHQESGIVYQDPGYFQTWETEVELPPDAQTLVIETVGTPKIRIPTGYTGTAVMSKVTGAVARDQDWTIGEFEIDDTPNYELDYALDIEDIKNGQFRKWFVDGAPGLRISGNADTPNQIHIENWQVFERGPGIHLVGGDPGSDQMHVFNPMFAETEVNNDPGVLNNGYVQTAYRDEGQNNNWLNVRAEQANIGLEIIGRQGHYLIQDMDRASDMERSIIERPGGGPSYIRGLSSADRFTNMEISHTNTTVECMGDSFGSTGEEPPATNYLPNFFQFDYDPVGGDYDVNSRLIEEIDNGGNVNYNATTYRVKPIILTSSTLGDGMEWRTFPESIKGRVMPKFLQSIEVSDTAGMLVRFGWNVWDSGLSQPDPDNFAHLIYDPDDSLSGSTYGSVPDPTGWTFRVVSGGVVDLDETLEHDPDGTGLEPIDPPSGAGSDNRDYQYAIGRARHGEGGNLSETTEWYAQITTAQQGSDIGEGGRAVATESTSWDNEKGLWRWVVENRDGTSNHSLIIQDHSPVRLWGLGG